MSSTVADKPTVARPFIKWAGGKTRLLPVLLPYVPESFRRFHEPFLGGGAFFFSVHSRGELAASIGDFNADLVNVWQIVQDDPAALHERLEGYVADDSEEFFYAIRGETYEDPVERAAHFVYLNKTAWNGLYRVNRWGEFNVPWGAREFSPPRLESLRAAAAELAGVRIANADFRESLARAEEGDFVYLDPPYLKVSDTSKFNGYTQQRFREQDLEDLATALRALSGRGVRWLLSNRDSEHLRALFPDCEIARLTVRRSVAAQNRRNVEPANSPEAVVSNRLALP
jgi:DNA adenine methylase